jgi:outer membrane protein
MRKLLPILGITLLGFLVLRGCSWEGSEGTAFDNTGLQYVAADRARERVGGPTPAPTERPDLEGFVGQIKVVDGKVSLSLQETVRRAMLNSLDIQVASYDPAIAETDVLAAESIFDPVLFLDGSLANLDRPNTAFLNLVGNTATMESTRAASIGIRKTFATGGTLTVSENYEYFRTNSPLMASPTYSTNFLVELSHPLLRNMGLDANKAQIYIASHNREATIADFQTTVLDVLVDIESTYWVLVFAVRDVDVRRRSVTLAEEVYRKEKIREEEAMSRPLEVSRARAAFTSRKAELIRAQNYVHDLSDKLKNLVNDPDLDLRQDVVIVPSDDPMILNPQIDRNEAVVAAINRRPELEQLRQQIKAIEAQQRYNKNQLLPRFDATFSYQRNSVGMKSSDAFREQGPGRFSDYTGGIVVEVPIGNRLAEANYRRGKLELQKAHCRLENLEQDIILQVNTAIREVETSVEEIAATREARIAAKDTLDGEQARYDVGDVTNEELLRAQRDLEEAERNEMQAVTRLMVSIIQVERAKGSLLDYNNIHIVPKDFDAPRQ